MTNEEAIKQIETFKCKYECNTDGFLGDDECRECEYGIVILALEKAEKYRWHDLRKDPNDLPDGRYLVWAFDGSEYGAAAFYATGIYHGWATSDQDFSPESIIAWKYIEVFEE